MKRMKKTYYIDIENGRIYPRSDEADWQFKIHATDKEVARLNDYINQNDHADLKTYVRAHIPFLEYHHDPQNDEYDQTMEGIYTMIYELGDERARKHIEKMGILKKEKLTFKNKH